MHPTMAMDLARSHARELHAEAASNRLAKASRTERPEAHHGASWGLRLRRAMPRFQGKAAGAATA